MAITNEEWKKLAKLLDDKLDQKLNKRFEHIDKRFDKTDARFEKIDARFEKTEKRFDEKLKLLGENIITQITGYIDESILPLINEKADKADVARIERKLDQAIDRLYGHEDRILAIESVPVVAHHLSIKKTGKKSSD